MKPAKRLLDGMPYTPSHSTDISKLFERIRREQKKERDAQERGASVSTIKSSKRAA
jgi:trehalose utilization protein